MGADKLRIICGPTGAGKSDLAMQLAAARHAAIISADSRQIYRGFDVGTAKPSRLERERICHFGVDVADPTERYSAARWSECAREWIAEAERLGLAPLITGGTGLYIKALVEPLFTSPQLDPERRAILERELAEVSTPELRKWCGEIDPARAHLGRTQLVRAIETFVLTGKRISTLHAEHHERRGGAEVVAHYLVVDPGPSLAERIVERIDAMLAGGWQDEVRALMQAVPADAPAWKASGYQTIREHVSGALDLSSARERVIIETRQYAKRQRTWFRHQLPAATVTRVNPDDPQAAVVVREWWESTE